MTEESASNRSTGTRRRTRRTGTRSTTSGRRTTTRGRRAGGTELVNNLNQMVDQLIKENRKLKRQVERLTAGGRAAATGTVERGLRTIQRRVQRAIGTGTGGRRRRTTTTRRRRTTTTRRRSTRSSESSS